MSVRGLRKSTHSTRVIQRSITGKKTKREIWVREQNESSHVFVAPDEFWDGTAEVIVVHVSAKNWFELEGRIKKEWGDFFFFVNCDYKCEVTDRGSRRREERWDSWPRASETLRFCPMSITSISSHNRWDPKTDCHPCLARVWTFIDLMRLTRIEGWSISPCSAGWGHSMRCC